MAHRDWIAGEKWTNPFIDELGFEYLQRYMKLLSVDGRSDYDTVYRLMAILFLHEMLTNTTEWTHEIVDWIESTNDDKRDLYYTLSAEGTKEFLLFSVWDVKRLLLRLYNSRLILIDRIGATPLGYPSDIPDGTFDLCFTCIQGGSLGSVCYNDDDMYWLKDNQIKCINADIDGEHFIYLRGDTICNKITVDSFVNEMDSTWADYEIISGTNGDSDLIIIQFNAPNSNKLLLNYHIS